MKKKIIFTTLAISLIGLFGFSFSQNGQQTKQVNAIATRKETKVSVSNDSPLQSDKIYYFVAKNYSQNGKGVFYQDTINLDNSATMPGNSYQRAIGEFTMISNNQMEKNLFAFVPALNGGVYKVSEVYLNNTATSNTSYVYVASASGGAFNRQYSAFIGTNFTSVYNNFYACLSQFFDVYLLDSGSFTFNQNINYHAPYGQDIDTYFVYDSNMVNASSTTTKTILENTPFYSGGLVYDTIRLRYVNAIAHQYLDSNGNRQTWTTNDFASYSWIEYVNSVTNTITIVNQRLTQAWNESNASGVVQLKGSKWLSTEYQTIQFFVTPNDRQTTTLSTLNNTSYQGNTYVSENIDIGLGNAFTLISQAFTAWLPIMSISVLPGITLGMLIFLPLVAGIIILIIWIVKR